MLTAAGGPLAPRRLRANAWHVRYTTLDTRRLRESHRARKAPMNRDTCGRRTRGKDRGRDEDEKWTSETGSARKAIKIEEGSDSPRSHLLLLAQRRQREPSLRTYHDAPPSSDVAVWLVSAPMMYGMAWRTEEKRSATHTFGRGRGRNREKLCRRQRQTEKKKKKPSLCREGPARHLEWRDYRLTTLALRHPASQPSYSRPSIRRRERASGQKWNRDRRAADRASTSRPFAPWFLACRSLVLFFISCSFSFSLFFSLSLFSAMPPLATAPVLPATPPPEAEDAVSPEVRSAPGFSLWTGDAKQADWKEYRESGGRTVVVNRTAALSAKAARLPSITLAEIRAKHASEESLWVVIEAKA